MLYARLYFNTLRLLGFLSKAIVAFLEHLLCRLRGNV